MPDLMLASSSDRGSDQAIREILAVMVFPSDAEQRSEYLEKLAVYAGDDQLLYKDLVTPGRKRPVSDLDKLHHNCRVKIVPGANLAGLMLLIAITADPEIASLNYARDTLTLIASTERAPRSRVSLGTYWRRYSSVSHMWAAAFVMQDRGINMSSEGLPGFPCHPSRIGMFVLLAERFRELGEATGANRSRTTFLDPDNTWKLVTEFDVYVGQAFALEFNQDHSALAAVMPKRAAEKSGLRVPTKI